MSSCKKHARFRDLLVEKYKKSAFLQHEMADRLCQRLSYTRIDAQSILVPTASDHYLVALLRERFPSAHLVTSDESWSYQNHYASQHSLNVASASVQQPFKAEQFDLIVANACLHMDEDPSDLLLEWRRLLKPGGLLLFATFGPDTLTELRQICQSVFSEPHVADFLDMHYLGDALLALHFNDPVVDLEWVTVHYNSLRGLHRDLHATASAYSSLKPERHAMHRAGWKAIQAQYERLRQEDGLPVTVELVFGQAWGPVATKTTTTDQVEEVCVPVSSIKQARQNSEC